jgi:hypothetical protein
MFLFCKFFRALIRTDRLADWFVGLHLLAMLVFSANTETNSKRSPVLTQDTEYAINVLSERRPFLTASREKHFMWRKKT